MPATIAELRARVSAATGPDKALDAAIHWAVAGDVRRGETLAVRPYSASLEEAYALIGEIFPGWWITGGLCELTGHASIGPDYNGSERERLKREFPGDEFQAFDADLAPGDGWHRTCYAALDCLLQAVECKARADQSAGIDGLKNRDGRS